MADDEQLRRYLVRATNELRTARTRLRELEARAHEPIAVVGAGCRFPGGVTGIEDLWRIAVDGVDATGGFPTDRGWTGPAGPLTGTGGFVATATGFDAAFFGIAAREAVAMDPQQRLLLEVAWEAIERAGLNPDTVRERRVGVFAGLSPSEYGPRMHEGGAGAGHILTGTAPSVVSGRVAYTLGLRGPALSVDTACSSSLVAVHLAGRALRAGDCELALAGGVSVLATPGIFAEFAAQGGLAADGRCKTFSAAADGTGWAEGAGVVVLERLSDALAAGHRIWAVIRGSAINQDGASNGLTAPSGPAQRRVIAAALADAGVRAGEVDVVEAHGTGTRLGDPIEAGALAAAYRPQPGDRPLWLGSVKSNIGHTQAAAGVAGLLKMIMAVGSGVLPRTLHASPPSPHIDWDGSGLALITETMAWPESDHPRRAGISSFGISGTNAHVILEQPPEQPVEPAAPAGDGPVVWPVSAKSPTALAAAGRRLRVRLADGGDWEPERIAWSLAATRATFDHRAVILGGTRAELLAGLDALGDGRTAPNLITGVAEPAGRLGYVFPGHGSQHPGMGRELAERHPVFADALDAACTLLEPHLPTPLRQVMFAKPGTPDAALLDDTRYTHAAVFAYQTALYRLLESLGLTPDVLIGHSLGEITAAHVAGVLTLADASTLISVRGGLLATLPEGAMAAVQADPEEIDRFPGVCVAAYNSPGSIVISGDPATVDEVTAHYRELGRRAVTLAIGHALHSPATHAVLDEFRREVERLTCHPATLPIISTLTGAPVADGQVLSAAHWCEHIRRPVRFAQAVAHLAGTATVLELAATPALAGHVRRCLPGSSVHTAGREPASLHSALAEAHTRTATAVRWQNLHPGPMPAVDLPTYPFQHRYLWHSAAVAAAGHHPLAGSPIPLAQNESRWFGGTLRVDEPWFLAQHTLLGTPVLPGSAMIEWALEALLASTADPSGCATLNEVTFLAPLPVTEGHPVAVQAMVETARRRVRCFARPADAPEAAAWTEHVTVANAEVGGTDRPPRVDLDRLRATLDPAEVEPLREAWARWGLGHGPAFRGLSRLLLGPDEALALIECGPTDGYPLHPVVTDAGIQLAAAFVPEPGEAAWLPAGVRRVVVFDRLPGRVWCQARWWGRQPSGDHTMDLSLLSESGEVLATLEGLRLHAVPRAALATLDGTRPSLQEIAWQPVPDGSAGVDPPGSWLEVDAGAELEQALATVGRADPEIAGLVIRCTAADPLGYPVTRAVFLVLQEFLRVHGSRRPDLVLCTDGELGTAMVGGLARAVAAEYPDLRCVLVDLGSAALPPAEVVRRARLAGSGQLALRDGRWYEARLRERALPDGAVPAVRPDAGYLITGGLGGLGLEVAGWLAGLGARCLLLTGRTLPAGEPAAVAALRAAGVRVELRQVDVADQKGMADLLRWARRELPPLRGVVHAAGVTADGALSRLDWPRFTEVLDPKVRGAWQLHQSTAGLELDFFVLFSSVASLLGTAGQANYAAANAFLDALARHRRALGLPAVSVSWGPWAGVGMAHRRDLIARLAAAGLRAVPASANLDALGRVLGGPAHVGIAAVDWRLVGAGRQVPDTLLAGLIPTAPPAEPATPHPAPDLARLATEDPVAAREAVVTGLLTLLAPVLRLAPEDQEELRTTARHRHLSKLGLDSLSAVQLQNRILLDFTADIPPEFLFNDKSVLDVAESICEQLALRNVIALDGAPLEVGADTEILTL